jgi:hypothetical protein
MIGDVTYLSYFEVKVTVLIAPLANVMRPIKILKFVTNYNDSYAPK